MKLDRSIEMVGGKPTESLRAMLYDCFLKQGRKEVSLFGRCKLLISISEFEEYETLKK